MIDLGAFKAVESALFIKWIIPNFGTALISDYNASVVLDGDTYTGTGNFLSISGTTSELKASPSQLTISLSGIPTTEVQNVLNNEIKGNFIEVRRAFFDVTTHVLLPLSTNPVMKFKGIVTNYGIDDDFNQASQTASTIITLNCNSIVEVLNKKVNGRRTNPTDFPNEDSMNRVSILASSNYQFGAPE